MSFRWTIDLTDSQIALMQGIARWEDGGFMESAQPFGMFAMYVTHIRVLDREGLTEHRPLTLKELQAIKKRKDYSERFVNQYPMRDQKGNVKPVLALTQKGRLVLQLIEIDIEQFAKRRVGEASYHETKKAALQE